MTERRRIRVSKTIADQLEQVRESGQVNMLDRQGVQVEANEMELYELVIWCEDHKKEYGRAIMEGFDVEAE